jgi:hypothetical protein
LANEADKDVGTPVICPSDQPAAGSSSGVLTSQFMGHRQIVLLPHPTRRGCSTFCPSRDHQRHPLLLQRTTFRGNRHVNPVPQWKNIIHIAMRRSVGFTGKAGSY